MIFSFIINNDAIKRQISKIHFTPEGEVSNYFNFLKKIEIRTERSTKNKSTQLSGFLLYETKRLIQINLDKK